MSEEKCPACKNTYRGIGGHWYHNPSHRPSIPPHLQEVICGIVMGDGYIADPSTIPYLEVDCVNREYLEYLNEIFGCLSKGVDLHKQNTTFDGYECKDVYRFRTSTHPKLKEFKEWYSTGKKVFPARVPMTPSILKHWYVGDGNRKNRNRIRISTHNEFTNKDKINEIFESAGLPKPNYWHGETGGYMAWNREETQFLLEYMGNPLPGFEYKFQQ